MKKSFFKKHFSKIIFLIIGVFISLSFYSTMAAWDDPASSGETLTVLKWNDVVDKLKDLDNRVHGIENTDSPLKLIAGASNWTEECKTILSPDGSVSFQPDSQFGNQSVNVYNRGWGGSFFVHDVVFEVENPEDSYCVGVNGTLYLTHGSGTYPSCTLTRYKGTTPTSESISEDDWITLWVNGSRQLGCPGDQGGGHGHPRYGKRCVYPINGTISSLQIDEADWSEDFSAWKYKIWFR